MAHALSSLARKGVAINFVKDEDVRILRDIEQCARGWRRPACRSFPY